MSRQWRTASGLGAAAALAMLFASAGAFAEGAAACTEEGRVLKNRALAACLDRSIGRLTASGRIGYEQWRADPAVFLRRADDARKRTGD